MKHHSHCQICHLEKPHNELMPLQAMRLDLITLAQQENPTMEPNGMICFADLNRLRAAFIRKALTTERNVGRLVNWKKVS